MNYKCSKCGWFCDEDFIKLVWKTVENSLPPDPLYCNVCGGEMYLEA